MLQRSEAEALAIACFRGSGATEADELVLYPDATLEYPWGWVFGWGTRKYLETGDMNDMLFGNGPVIVDRHTGKVEVCGTMYPPEHYAKLYARRAGYSRPWWKVW